MLMKNFIEGLGPNNPSEYVAMMQNVLKELRDRLWKAFMSEQNESNKEEFWRKYNDVLIAIGKVESNTFKDIVETVLFLEL